ncbi:MAG: fatty acid desaturase [Pirellulaceae bacterium]
MRTGKELLIASKDFAKEQRWRSWLHFWTTLTLLVGLIVVAALPLSLLIRIPASLLAGLVCVRMFIIFHDYQHHAILNNSKIASVILWIYGIFTLSPPSVWHRSHSHHHKHNSKNFGPNVGSFPVMTTDYYRDANWIERFGYLVTRHPLTIVFGYVTIFMWGMSIRPFVQHPGRHFDGGIAVLNHFVLTTTLGFTLGPTSVLLAVVLPLFVACLIGGYLFYAQHNFPSAELLPDSEWSHVDAALKSSSFMRMGPILNWFTGNIGFHHVHHMNALIPFYRLPEAMEALEELQTPGETSLHPRDIRACLSLKLWDQTEGQFVPLSKVSS